MREIPRRGTYLREVAMRKVPVYAASLLIVAAWNGIAQAEGTPSAVSAPRSFTALERTDAQALMPEEMREIAGQGNNAVNKPPIDPTVIAAGNFAALAAGLDPATKAQLAGVLAGGQQPVLSTAIKFGYDIKQNQPNGTEAQGIAQD